MLLFLFGQLFLTNTEVAFFTVKVNVDLRDWTEGWKTRRSGTWGASVVEMRKCEERTTRWKIGDGQCRKGESDREVGGGKKRKIDINYEYHIRLG